MKSQINRHLLGVFAAFLLGRYRRLRLAQRLLQIEEVRADVRVNHRQVAHLELGVLEVAEQDDVVDRTGLRELLLALDLIVPKHFQLAREHLQDMR